MEDSGSQDRPHRSTLADGKLAGMEEISTEVLKGLKSNCSKQFFIEDSAISSMSASRSKTL